MKHGPKKSSKDKSVRNSGYAAPEYVENGKVSNKTDVYSFGVVLLELISGRRATDKLPGGKSLVDWVRRTENRGAKQSKEATTLAFRRIFGLGVISRFLEVEETSPLLCNLLFSLITHFSLVKGVAL